jgi:hypothetical protein
MVLDESAHSRYKITHMSRPLTVSILTRVVLQEIDEEARSSKWGDLSVARPEQVESPCCCCTHRDHVCYERVSWCLCECKLCRRTITLSRYLRVSQHREKKSKEKLVVWASPFDLTKTMRWVEGSILTSSRSLLARENIIFSSV